MTRFFSFFTNLWHLMLKELKSYFTSPVAYLVLSVFTIISGLYFYIVLSSFYTRINQYKVYSQLYRNPEFLERINLNEMVISPLFQFLIIVLIFIVPALTMRLIADEKKAKTDELLLTTPLSLYEIVLGKFLGSFLFLLILLSTTLVFIAILFIYGAPELGPVITGYLGLILIGTVLLAIGIFASSLTANQINSYFISFAIGLLLLITGWAGQLTSERIGGVLNYLSITSHYQNLAKGLIDSKDICYYLSFIVFFLFMAKSSVESMRWR
ncbi:MAG: ABC transporter permease subunit [Pseudomonadota bacterium]